MKVSAFGEKLTKGAGILSLMDDLGNALAEGGKIMMGGGNPGHIPQIQELMRERLRMLVEDDQALRKLIGVYDPPRGDGSFRRALAALLRREYGWKIDEDNICLTNGSQGAFFLLFNLLAGKTTQGGNRKILLPLAPEYIGYADLGLSEDFFTSVRPRIELIGDHFFKYRVNFDRIDLTEEIAAICVSRPTNPTGNVLTAEEIAGLSRLAQAHDLPLTKYNAEIFLNETKGMEFRYAEGLKNTDQRTVKILENFDYTAGVEIKKNYHRFINQAGLKQLFCTFRETLSQQPFEMGRMTYRSFDTALLHNDIAEVETNLGTFTLKLRNGDWYIINYQ